MSVEQIAFDAEPQHDSTPIETVIKKDSQTYHEIWHEDAEAKAFREEEIAKYHAQRLGQIPVARTRAEEIGRHNTLNQQAYEIDRDRL